MQETKSNTPQPVKQIPNTEFPRKRPLDVVKTVEPQTRTLTHGENLDDGSGYKGV